MPTIKKWLPRRRKAATWTDVLAAAAPLAATVKRLDTQLAEAEARRKRPTAAERKTVSVRLVSGGFATFRGVNADRDAAACRERQEEIRLREVAAEKAYAALRGQ